MVIARILHGGLIYKQGLLQVGDQIMKVNQENVGSMTPIELQDMLVRVGEGGGGGAGVTIESCMHCALNVTRLGRLCNRRHESVKTSHSVLTE